VASGTIQGISCVTYRLAGVYGFAGLWNDGTWRLAPFAKPSGSTGWNVLAVGSQPAGEFYRTLGEGISQNHQTGQ
jgi:hypothetical protein